MDGISIVIISRGREKLLDELLQSVQVARQKVDFPTEVILVDSSLGDSRPRVLELSKKYHTSYFYQDITVSAKRNYGARQSRYEVILFLDSDCLVTPDILKHYADIYQKHPDAAGAAGPLEFVGEDTWFWRVVEKTPYTIFFSMARWGETMKWSPTANFSVNRDLFLSVGGFDEDFPKNPGGEDVDLGFRMSKTGRIIYSVPEALVYHSKATWSPVKAMFRRVFHYGTGEVYLVERYPEMVCDSMPRRVVMTLAGILLYIWLGVLVNPWLFTGILLIPAYEIIATSVCVNLFAKYKAAPLGKQIVVQLLILWNEAGYLWGCISKKKLHYMKKQLIHFKPQMDGICYQNVMSAVMDCFFLLITYIIVMTGV